MEKMATNKSQNKNPSFKIGQLWHTIDDTAVADEDDTEEEDEPKKESNETMRLRREDMSLFGICPAWDQFYLVVCEYCQQVIKPQALQKHIELRHSYHKNNSNNQMSHPLKVQTDITNITSNSSSVRRSSSTATTATKITENGSDINDNDVKVKLEVKSEPTVTVTSNSVNSDLKVKLFSTSVQTPTQPQTPEDNRVIDDCIASSAHHHNNHNSPHTVVRTVDTNCVKSESSEMSEKDEMIKLKTKLINLLSPTMSSTPSVEVPAVPEPTGPGPGPGFATIVSADSEAVTISVPEINSSPNSVTNTNNNEPEVATVAKPPPKKKSYKKSANPRKLLPCKDREYDPNKHCGVCLPEMERPCTRSLTCKTHSLTLRRAVQGRIKNFDDLLAEHREAKEAALRAQGIEVKPTKKSIQKQQQQLKASQLLQLSVKAEHNSPKTEKVITSTSHPSIPIPRTLVLSESQTQTMFTNLRPNSNSLLALKSPIVPTLASVPHREPHRVPIAQRSNLRLDQIESSSSDAMWMRCHPRPAAVCNFNVRALNGSRLVSRANDLTLAALRSTFNDGLFDNNRSGRTSSLLMLNDRQPSHQLMSPSSNNSSKGEEMRAHSVITNASTNETNLRRYSRTNDSELELNGLHRKRIKALENNKVLAIQHEEKMRKNEEKQRRKEDGVRLEKRLEEQNERNKMRDEFDFDLDFESKMEEEKRLVVDKKRDAVTAAIQKSRIIKKRTFLVEPNADSQPVAAMNPLSRSQ